MNGETILKLQKLIQPPQWRGKLKPEASVQRDFVKECVAWTLEGNLKAVWCSVPNENSSNHNPVFGSMLRCLGKIKGAPDLVFLWKDGSGCLEFKGLRAKQTEFQELYEFWTRQVGVNYAVVRSKKEAYEKLIEWGALLPTTPPPIERTYIELLNEGIK